MIAVLVLFLAMSALSFLFAVVLGKCIAEADRREVGPDANESRWAA